MAVSKLEDAILDLWQLGYFIEIGIINDLKHQYEIRQQVFPTFGAKVDISRKHLMPFHCEHRLNDSDKDLPLLNKKLLGGKRKACDGLQRETNGCFSSATSVNKNNNATMNSNQNRIINDDNNASNVGTQITNSVDNISDRNNNENEVDVSGNTIHDRSDCNNRSV